jgi:hypothetical protein
LCKRRAEATASTASERNPRIRFRAVLQEALGSKLERVRVEIGAMVDEGDRGGRRILLGRRVVLARGRCLGRLAGVAFQPRLIIVLPRGGAVERELSRQSLAAIDSGEVVVEPGPTDDEGILEPSAAGEVVLSVPSPEALRRQQEDVRRVIADAGTAAEPLLIEVEAADELRADELAAVLDAAGHTSRAVILRIIRDA